MKKEELCQQVLCYHSVTQFKRFLFLLGHVVVLTLILTLNVTAKSYSQGEKIDLAVEDVKLKAVFPILEERGKIRLMYSEEGSALEQLVTLEVQDTPVLTVLDMLLVNTSLEYKELDNDLVVVRNKVLQQEITVRGVVRGTDNQPLSGVSVLVKGTTRGVSSDENGNFTITAPANATLVFSYIGYVTHEAAINGQSSMTVTLDADAQALGEVVVTALGITRERKSLSYSVTEVAGEDLSKAREINLGNALTGRVAGLNATSTATGPGGSTRIVIRGNGSLNGDNQPL